MISSIGSNYPNLSAFHPHEPHGTQEPVEHAPSALPYEAVHRDAEEVSVKSPGPYTPAAGPSPDPGAANPQVPNADSFSMLRDLAAMILGYTPERH